MSKLHKLNELEPIFSPDNKPSEGISWFFQSIQYTASFRAFRENKIQGDKC